MSYIQNNVTLLCNLSLPFIHRSYTTFMYSDLVVSPSTVKAGDNVTVKVAVENVGNMDGYEVNSICC